MVRVTAKALVTLASEPSRSHARDLVILGHLLASRLKRDGAISADSDFALVWRDAVVPIAAASRYCYLHQYHRPRHPTIAFATPSRHPRRFPGPTGRWACARSCTA